MLARVPPPPRGVPGNTAACTRGVCRIRRGASSRGEEKEKSWEGEGLLQERRATVVFPKVIFKSVYFAR